MYFHFRVLFSFEVSHNLVFPCSFDWLNCFIIATVKLFSSRSVDNQLAFSPVAFILFASPFCRCFECFHSLEFSYAESLSCVSPKLMSKLLLCLVPSLSLFCVLSFLFSHPLAWEKLFRSSNSWRCTSSVWVSCVKQKR